MVDVWPRRVAIARNLMSRSPTSGPCQPETVRECDPLPSVSTPVGDHAAAFEIQAEALCCGGETGGVLDLGLLDPVGPLESCRRFHETGKRWQELSKESDGVSRGRNERGRDAGRTSSLSILAFSARF